MIAIAKRPMHANLTVVNRRLRRGLTLKYLDHPEGEAQGGSPILVYFSVPPTNMRSDTRFDRLPDL